MWCVSFDVMSRGVCCVDREITVMCRLLVAVDQLVFRLVANVTTNLCGAFLSGAFCGL